MQKLQELKLSLTDTANTCGHEALAENLRDLNDDLQPQITIMRVDELLDRFHREITPFKNELGEQKLAESNIQIRYRLAQLQENLQAIRTQMDISSASRWQYSYPVNGEHDVNQHNHTVANWLTSRKVLTNELNANIVEEVIAKMPATDVVKLIEELCLDDIRFQGEPIDHVILSRQYPVEAKIFSANEKKIVTVSVPVVGVEIGSLLNREQATVDLQTNQVVRGAPTDEQEPIMSMHIQLGFKVVRNKLTLFYKHSMQPEVLSLICNGATMYLTHNQRDAQATHFKEYQRRDDQQGIVTQSFKHWAGGKFSELKTARDMRIYNRMRPELITFNGQQLDKEGDVPNEQKEKTVQAQIHQFVVGAQGGEPTNNQQTMIDFLCTAAPTESIFSDYLQDWGKAALRVYGAPAEQVGVEMGKYKFQFINDDGQIRMRFFADINRFVPPMMMGVPGYQIDRMGNVVVFGQEHRASDLITDPVKFMCEMRFDVKEGEIIPVLEQQQMSIDNRIRSIEFTDDTIEQDAVLSQEEDTGLRFGRK